MSDKPPTPKPSASKIGSYKPTFDPYVTFFGIEEPAEAPDFYIALGRMVALWGRAELCLQEIKIRIDRPEITGQPTEKERVSLDQRLKHLRRLYANVPELENLKDSAHELLAQSKIVARKRNKVLHAAFWSFAPDPPFRALFYSIIRDDRPKTMDELRPSITLTWLVDLVGEIGVLTYNLWHHLIQLDRHLEAIGKAPAPMAMHWAPHPPTTE